MTDICPIVNTERLLLATESSEFSEGAIREAIRLAKRCGSKLTAMSVIEPRVRVGGAGDPGENGKRSAGAPRWC
jgi:nucleotide-binding universal stress UspA family protein